MGETVTREGAGVLMRLSGHGDMACSAMEQDEIEIVEEEAVDIFRLKGSIGEADQKLEEEQYEQEEEDRNYDDEERGQDGKEGLEGLIQLFPVYAWVDYFLTLLVFLVLLVIYNASFVFNLQTFWV